MCNRSILQRAFLILCIGYFTPSLFAVDKTPKRGTAVIMKMGIEGQSVSGEWRSALTSRMSKEMLDSFAALERPLSDGEIEWKKLIENKLVRWNEFRDSLASPFRDITLSDTIYVMLGFLGNDDGFTFGKQTICLDLTALLRAYGIANLAENSSRIDRIFAHEYTHLLHKAWAAKIEYAPATFLDDILWECLYEGIGMYRSLNPKWLPTGDSVPAVTKAALDELYPIFTERMTSLKKSTTLTDSEKQKLHAGLSRGPVNKKWGAFPIAIWLSLEAKGNDKNLINWTERGPTGVIELAKKYLPDEYKKRFMAEY